MGRKQDGWKTPRQIYEAKSTWSHGAVLISCFYHHCYQLLSLTNLSAGKAAKKAKNSKNMRLSVKGRQEQTRVGVRRHLSKEGDRDTKKDQPKVAASKLGDDNSWVYPTNDLLGEAVLMWLSCCPCDSLVKRHCIQG